MAEEKSIVVNSGNDKLKIGQYLRSSNVQKYVESIIGHDRTDQFVVSIISAVNQNRILEDCSKASIMSAAITATALDLSLNPSIGQAYIVPYNDKHTGTKVAQFQIGWKGLIELALRTGQYSKINVTRVYTDEKISENPMTGDISVDWLDFDKRIEANLAPFDKKKISGYLAYFRLHDGFEKMSFMSVEQLDRHAYTYSKSLKNGTSSIWTSDFESMAMKTVLKLLINKYGPKSSEMKQAIEKDQSVIDVSEDDVTDVVNYIDNDGSKNLTEKSKIGEHKK